MKQGYFNTADSAHLYYEVRGTGRPLVLTICITKCAAPGARWC